MCLSPPGLQSAERTSDRAQMRREGCRYNDGAGKETGSGDERDDNPATRDLRQGRLKEETGRQTKPGDEPHIRVIDTMRAQTEKKIRKHETRQEQPGPRQDKHPHRNGKLARKPACTNQIQSDPAPAFQFLARFSPPPAPHPPWCGAILRLMRLAVSFASSIVACVSGLALGPLLTLLCPVPSLSCALRLGGCSLLPYLLACSPTALSRLSCLSRCLSPCLLLLRLVFR